MQTGKGVHTLNFSAFLKDFKFHSLHFFHVRLIEIGEINNDNAVSNQTFTQKYTGNKITGSLIKIFLTTPLNIISTTFFSGLSTVYIGEVSNPSM